jgi:hypothetical protein
VPGRGNQQETQGRFVLTITCSTHR